MVNEVLYEYDTNGLLSKDYSNPSGAVSTSTTPYIAYTYDTTASGGYFTKRLRPVTMKYPGGKVLTYAYGVANSSDDFTDRITAIKDGATDVVTYPNNNTVSYPQPGLTLDYTSGLDRFNRIIDHTWKKGTTNVVQIKHGYDRVGNRLYREDTVGTSFSEMYAYDGVNQLIDMQRGVINSTKTGVTTKKAQEQFAFDATGNWGTYKQDLTGAGFTLNQSRTHTKANEIATIAGASTYVVSDLNGNMTKLPKPDNWSAAFACVFDAWNRLVKVQDGATVVATYSYNSLNHRVKKVVGSETRLFYFNDAWQCLEERVGSTVDLTYTWGLRYIDDLVYRDKGEERLYSLADPNWNVVTIANASGVVLERMVYSAFGKVNWLDASFGTKVASGYTWARTFTGQVLDGETGLMLYRNRFYHTALGRFVTRDPIGYDGEHENLYRYIQNKPIFVLDPLGLYYIEVTCTGTLKLSSYRIKPKDKNKTKGIVKTVETEIYKQFKVQEQTKPFFSQSITFGKECKDDEEAVPTFPSYTHSKTVTDPKDNDSRVQIGDVLIGYILVYKGEVSCTVQGYKCKKCS